MFKMTLTALALSLSFSLPASFAAAELSPADIATVESQSGIRVFTSDGDFVGVSNGIRVGERHTRLYLFKRAGSIFRSRGGRDIVITTTQDQLTLNGNSLTLAASTQRVHNKARTATSGGSGPITVLLQRR